nr:hypothetical protein [Tanacetum cinerariifolium]
MLAPESDEILPVNKKSILKNTNVLTPEMYKIHTDHTQTRTSKLPPDSRKTNKRVCVMIEKHDLCVPKSVAKPLKKTVASESIKKPRNNVRKLHERFGKTYKWTYSKFTPSGYIWKSKSKQENVNLNVSMPLGVPLCQILHCLLVLLQLVEIFLFIVDSGCSKHMMGNLKFLINFMEKFLGTVKFGNDQIAPILRYDLEVAFRKSTCFICDLKENDLLSAWLWHRRLSYLNFDTINLLSKNDIVVGLPKTLHAYFAAEGIQHQTSIARTPEQYGVVERRNLIPRHEKTPYHIINDQKPSVKFFHIFGFVCYIVRDGENLDKMKEKGDECIFVGYSNQSKAYRVFNKITRVIMESIHVNFDELPQMASDKNSSDPAPESQIMALNHDNLSPIIQRQGKVTQADRTVTTSNELNFLFSPMFDELLNGSSKVVSKSSTVSAADALNQRQQLTTPLTNHITPEPTCQVPTLAPTVISSENINQAETHAENDQVADDEFINIFSTSVQDEGETSSRHVDSSNMHTFYQRFPSEHRWTKDHPLEQVIENPSQSVRTRRQLESDAEMCMFALTMSRTEPKNIKEAMADSA